ncbi:MAG: hypothetical protein A2286_12770 [Gammaproteobacteria bacterium RIFOXYA12_FULL_61_12]|nr:MAG: hypothetical protein A2514_03225 [Gammaproteobacteria bacterium RIFOXYD12_FULL_61_37]OGT89770.1 MAG: hypothetical protein A2286_12770 [Gammaproteobacteria bacterium RIFOXYA12_FULL_61_12]
MIAVMAGSTGCAIQPKPMTAAEVQDRIRSDHDQMFAQQEPITGPVTLPEALARALKYNLDHRVKQMEIALANRILQSASADMLPRLALDAGYSNRSNYSGGTSMGIESRQVTLIPSTSQERSYADANLNLVWNVLDFGVSKVTAEQKATDVLITLERRRRVMQNIWLDTNEAYWNAVAAQRLLPDLNRLITKTRRALGDSRKMESTAAQNPEVALNYQKRLMKALEELSKLRKEMTLAKARLGALMNLGPGADYRVAVPKGMDVPGQLGRSLEELEQLALANQPELREEDYKTRIRVLDVKKAVLRMYPGLELSLGGHANDNSFLYNNSWFDVALRLSWNLIHAIHKGPAEKREAQAHVELADSRRMALSMAVLTQVWVGHARYQLARDDHALAGEMLRVENRLGELTQRGQQAETRSQMDVVLASAETLAARMRQEVSLAQLHASQARLFHTVGVDPLDYSLFAVKDYAFSQVPVKDLTQQIEQQLARPL